MKNCKNGILSKINTLKINKNILCPKKISQKYITPRQTTVLKNPINSNSSIKIKVNIKNNEENININTTNSKRIKKSKSKPKLIKKDSKKDILVVNKSFNINKTIKNKNKKNDINFNSTINTFFTTQNDNNNYNNYNTEINKELTVHVNMKKRKEKNKIIKKRKSFGYSNSIFIDSNTNNTNNTNTNNFSKKNETIKNDMIKKTKSNTNIKINLKKKLNNSINNIKIKKIENKTQNSFDEKEKEINIIQKNKKRISKSAKKLIIKKNKNNEDKNIINKASDTKSKINVERSSINGIKINQILSPIKPNNKKLNNIDNNSEFKKRNSLNLFNQNSTNNNNITDNTIKKTKNNKPTKNNIKNNPKKNNTTIKNVLSNKNINKNNERKSTNNRQNKILIKVENNKKQINKKKSSKNNNNNDIEKKEINEENQKSEEKIENIEKEENNDSIILNKDDKENINSLNISSSKASSSNRLKDKKSKTIEHIEQINIIKSDQKEFKLEELDEPNIISIPFNKNKINKIIINFDDLIEFDSKFDNIIIFLSSISNNNINLQPSNECSEFFSFYFHSSLNNIFGNFFSKKNRIIINSGNNLFLFCVLVLYHLSLNYDMLIKLLDDMKYIFSLLKINFYFLMKKIEYYYDENFPIKCADLINQKIVQYKTINCNNEIDLISKINKNCVNVTERMKIVLNYYERINNKFFDEFSGIFKNLSTLNEQDINNYFFSYLYQNPFFNKENNKINEVNNINKNYKNKNFIKNNNNNSNNDSSSDINNYLSDNLSKSDNDNDQRELFSVKSYKSSNYFGKLKSDNNSTTTINCENNFYYNIENNIYENDSDGSNAYEIMQMIKDYEINKVPSPFIISKTKKRLTLILDLDETLIHLRQKKQIVNIKNDINININNLKEKKNYLLQFRVGLFSFLTLLKPFYEIISFTSASKEYADVIINEIEKKRNFFDYKFYREHCVIYKDTFVKDISRIGRDIKNIIIVDNNENNFMLNKENGIKICSYYGDDEENNGNKKNDNALLELKKILINIYKDNYDDVREALKDYDEIIKTKVSIDS